MPRLAFGPAVELAGAVPRTKDVPLCVELDRTLVKTDTFHEYILRLARTSPFLALAMLLRRHTGATASSRKIADPVLDPALLPYDDELVAYLRAEKDAGRRLWLVGGASSSVAAGIAQHLGMFEGVVSTGEHRDTTSEALRDELGRRFPAGYDYAGRGSARSAAWGGSRRRIRVGPRRGAARDDLEGSRIDREFVRERSLVRAALQAMRLRQWAKNAFVFLPVLAAHRLLDVVALQRATLAFVVFGVFASAGYLVNDLLDVESDRKHVRKRHRAIASGALPIPAAAFLVPALLALGAALATALPAGFVATLGGYFALAIAYSAFLKQRAIVDVLVLATFYTMRIFAGGFATNIVVSEWLATFSMFLCLSLAFLKRTSELVEGGSAPPGRGYRMVDQETVATLGTGSGYLSVLVLALYISSPDVRVLYARPDVLWAVCPLALYWISRLWLLARRGEIHGDPFVFAVRDRHTYVVGALALAALAIAAWT